MRGLIGVLVVLIVLGLVAMVVLVLRSRVPVRPPADTSRRADLADVRRHLTNLRGSMVGVVSPDVLARYEAIHRRILALLPRVGQLEDTSQDLFILRRTAADYLPTAVRTYVTLVRSGAAERPLPDGRTPHQVLLEQLDLIETGLAGIGEALDRADVDRLLVHGRFLEARFGTAARLAPSAPATGEQGS